MESSALSFIDKILDSPMKAMVVASAIISYFVVKKYSSLLDKTFKLFDEHKNDLKDAGKNIGTTRDEITLVKNELVNQIINLRQEILILNDRLHDIQERYLNDVEELKKIKKIESEVKENYGKIIFIEEKIRASDNKLDKTREQLRDAIIILQKHKEKISKL